MNYRHYLAIAAAVLLVIILYSLPKVVVSKKEEQAKEGAVRDAAKAPANDEHSEAEHSENDGHNHAAEVSPEKRANISKLSKDFKSASDQKSKADYAGKLAEIYNSIGKFDSSAIFQEANADFYKSAESYGKAADRYFDVAGVASTAEARAKFQNKARELYEKALKVSPNNGDIKAKLAMTWVDSDSPMKAIGILREVLAAEPENQTAIYNLGLLSMQSQQWDKAVTRFEQLLKLNPKNAKAQFYMALSLKESGQKAKAIEAFKKLKTLDNDPVVQSTADGYLEELQAGS